MKTRAGLLPAGPCRPQPHPRRYIRGRQLGRERQPSYRRSSWLFNDHSQAAVPDVFRQQGRLPPLAASA